ncbi:MAG: hypothetical protein K6D94_05545 [Clostridiales bacterium]|nr:hypothetical protein [Clostridiales bacterium]
MRTLTERLALTLIVLISAAALSLVSFAAAPVKAPGGKVTDAASFIAALGGDEAAYIGDDGKTIIFLSDIEIYDIIDIVSGEYIVSGTGCYMTRAEGREICPIFEVSGGHLTLGSEKGSNDHPSLTLDGEGREGLGPLIAVDGGQLDIYIGTLLCGNRGSVGAIHSQGGETNVYAAKITDCGSASSSGGAAYVEENGNISFYGGDYQNNTAGAGGFAYVKGGTLTAVSAVIAYDTAAMGGAIFNDGGTVVLSEIPMQYCTSTTRAGAIYNTGDLTVSGGYIAYSDSPDTAALWNTGKCVISGSEITMCTATNYCAVYNTGSIHQISTDVNNNTSEETCAVYNSGEYVLTEGSVSSNTAKVRFGGIINDGTFTVDSGSISSNKSKGDCQYGLAMVNRGKVILRDNAFLSFNNDVLMVFGYGQTDPRVEVENELTANTPIITLTPAVSDPSRPDGFRLDFGTKKQLVFGKLDECSKLTATDHIADEYIIGDDGRLKWDGFADNDEGKGRVVLIVGVCVIAAAAVGGTVAATVIRAGRKKKKAE